MRIVDQNDKDRLIAEKLMKIIKELKELDCEAILMVLDLKSQNFSKSHSMNDLKALGYLEYVKSEILENVKNNRTIIK